MFSRALRGVYSHVQSRPRLPYAFALGSGSVFFLNTVRHSSSSPSSTTYLLHTPPRSAPREVPTPLVFVSSSRLDASSKHGMNTAATWLAQRGYTCLEIDLGHPEGTSTSEELMARYEADLAAHVRLLAIPFAPVVVARAGGTLVAQTYISSHPATALLLISPPPSNASPAATTLLKTPLPEFNFEARFPCAVMCTEAERAGLEGSRLWEDPEVDRMVVKDAEAVVGQEGLVKIEQWLDEIGI